MTSARLLATAFAVALTLIGHAALPVGTATATAAAQERGAVTGLPIPRFVSLKSGEGRARRGPGLTHRVDWVYQRRGMPLRVTAEFEHWRRVEDNEGAGGWMHYALLSGVRTVLVQSDMLPLRVQSDDRASVAAYLEAGVVARIMSCGPEWCRLNADGLRGWARKSDLWGVLPEETID
jgi:SH3-like domain-containing protein